MRLKASVEGDRGSAGTAEWLVAGGGVGTPEDVDGRKGRMEERRWDVVGGGPSTMINVKEKTVKRGLLTDS